MSAGILDDAEAWLAVLEKGLHDPALISPQECHVSVALARYRMGDYSEAYSEIREMASDEVPKSWLILALIHHVQRLGNAEEAATALDRAGALPQPGRPTAARPTVGVENPDSSTPMAEFLGAYSERLGGKSRSASRRTIRCGGSSPLARAPEFRIDRGGGRPALSGGRRHRRRRQCPGRSAGPSSPNLANSSVRPSICKRPATA